MSELSQTHNFSNLLRNALNQDVGIDYALGLLKNYMDSDPKITNFFNKYKEQNARRIENNIYDHFIYCDLDSHLPRELKRIRILGLHKKENMRILEISCGHGLLAYIAKLLGHEVIGLDVSDHEFLHEYREALGINCVETGVVPLTALPDLGKFDYIISMGSVFHRDNGKNDCWEVPEWQYFLEDLEKRINNNAVIFFDISTTYKYYISANTFDLFVKHGFRLFNRVMIKESHTTIFNELGYYTICGAGGVNTSSYKYFSECWANGTNRPIDPLKRNFKRCYQVLSSKYPDAIDLKSHKALYNIITDNKEEAITLLCECVKARPQFTGYATALCQLISLPELQANKQINNQISEAKALLLNTLRKNNSLELLSRIEAANTDPSTKLASLSPFWQQRAELIARHPVFAKMLKARPELATQADPVDYYLRYGAMSLAYSNTSFTPIRYLGANNDVFINGIDPLVHYIVHGEREGRAGA